MKKTETIISKGVLEDLLWTSIRYCVGRHSYVAGYYVDYAKLFYSLDEHQLMAISRDIDEEIRRQLEIAFNVRIQNNCDALDRFITWLQDNNIHTVAELQNIKEAEITGLTATPETISYVKELNVNRTASYMDITDLIGWYYLARLFDVGNHKIITTKDGNKYRVFSAYKEAIELEEDGRHYRTKEMYWDKVFIMVEEFVKSANCLSYLSITEAVDVAAVDVPEC